MEFSNLGFQAMSRADFWFFIIAMYMTNRTMGIPPLEGRLFVNLLIFAYLQVFCAHRMHAFGVAMRSVSTESLLLKEKGSRDKARRVQTRGDGGRVNGG